VDYEGKNKRTKVDEFEAYGSSSNQDTDEGETYKEIRPEGQKKAKARMREKGKGKAIPQSPLGMQPDEDMVLFHDAMSNKASALEKNSSKGAG
jgi:predicted transposase YdaD